MGQWIRSGRACETEDHRHPRGAWVSRSPAVYDKSSGVGMDAELRTASSSARTRGSAWRVARGEATYKRAGRITWWGVLIVRTPLFGDAFCFSPAGMATVIAILISRCTLPGGLTPAPGSPNVNLVT